MFQAMPPPSLYALTSGLSALPPAHVNTSEATFLELLHVKVLQPTRSPWIWPAIGSEICLGTISFGDATGGHHG
jgi:hypothetical protein